MDGTPTPPAPKRSKRSRQSVPLAYVAHQYATGKTTRELGEQYGVSHTTITRWLDQTDQAKHTVERFKQNRADILARIQSKSLVLQEQIVDELLKDGLANAYTPQQKQQLMFTLNTIHGTLFDKERLERGQSTANISTLSRLIDQSITTAHQRHRRTPQHIDSAPVHNVENSDDSNDSQ